MNLVEGLPRNNSVRLFWNRAIGQGGDVILKFIYFQLWRPFCSAELNHLSNFDRGSPKEHFREILIIGLGGDVVKSIFSIFSSGSHFVQRSGTILTSLVEGHQRNISEKLKLAAGLGWDVIKEFSIFSSGSHFVQRSGTIFTSLVEGHQRNISVKLKLAAGLGWDVIKEFSIFSSGSHFVQRSGTILTSLVEGHQRNISVKLKLAAGLGWDVIKEFSIFSSGGHFAQRSGTIWAILV